jgi:hypothetical protein
MKKQLLAAGFGLVILASAFVVPHTNTGTLAVNQKDTVPADTTKPKDTIKLDGFTAYAKDTVPSDTTKPKKDSFLASKFYNVKDTVPTDTTKKPSFASLVYQTMANDTTPKKDTTKPQFGVLAYNQ